VFVPGRECCRTPRLGRRPSGGNAPVCCRPGNFTVKLRNNNKNREDLPMDVVPLGPGFAAELRGVTLKDVASDEAAYAATRTAFEEHSVLVLRGQEVTDELGGVSSRRAAAKPNSSRPGLPSSASTRACATGSRIPLPGTTTRI